MGRLEDGVAGVDKDVGGGYTSQLDELAARDRVVWGYRFLLGKWGTNIGNRYALTGPFCNCNILGRIGLSATPFFYLGLLGKLKIGIFYYY
jgi:hypothetical protein